MFSKEKFSWQSCKTISPTKISCSKKKISCDKQKTSSALRAGPTRDGCLETTRERGRDPLLMKLLVNVCKLHYSLVLRVMTLIRRNCFKPKQSQRKDEYARTEKIMAMTTHINVSRTYFVLITLIRIHWATGINKEKRLFKKGILVLKKSPIFPLHVCKTHGR